MNVNINGKPARVEANVSVQGLLDMKSVDNKKVVVELNGAILKQDEYDRTVLGENDSIEIVSFVGGG